MNAQRRMFRGRGGPNDRRLPKFNARRRRRHPSPDGIPVTTTGIFVTPMMGRGRISSISSSNNDNNNNDNNRADSVQQQSSLIIPITSTSRIDQQQQQQQQPQQQQQQQYRPECPDTSTTRSDLGTDPSTVQPLNSTLLSRKLHQSVGDLPVIQSDAISSSSSWEDMTTSSEDNSSSGRAEDDNKEDIPCNKNLEQVPSRSSSIGKKMIRKGIKSVVDSTNTSHSQMMTSMGRRPFVANDHSQNAIIEATINNDEENPLGQKRNHELRHLHHRIQNVTSAIQTSQAIMDPIVYQNQVLRAVINCIGELNAIIRHYPASPIVSVVVENETSSTTTAITVAHGEADSNRIDNDDRDRSITWSKEYQAVALKMFGLIQHALQCGPLRGSNPGYMKRCGSEVAKMVGEFLDKAVHEYTPKQHAEVIRDSAPQRQPDESNPPGLSSWIQWLTAPQQQTLARWRLNAAKAQEKNKPPSKAVQKKLQDQIKKQQRQDQHERNNGSAATKHMNNRKNKKKGTIK